MSKQEGKNKKTNRDGKKWDSHCLDTSRQHFFEFVVLAGMEVCDLWLLKL